MGKAVIVSEQGEGLYTVKKEVRGLASARALAADRRARLEAELPDLRLEEEEAVNAVVYQRFVTDTLLNDWLAGIEIPEDTLNFELRYGITDEARAYVQAQTTGLEVPAALMNAIHELVEKRMILDDIRRKLLQNSAEYLAVLKWQGELTALQNSADTEIPAWCADYTEGLTGEVATLEVPGEVDPIIGGGINIKPGDEDGAEWTADYGQIQFGKTLSPAGFAWNMTMLTPWMKWMPLWRYATVTAVNASADTVNVALQPVLSKVGAYLRRDLTVNDPWLTSMSQVPVQYMACGAGVFEPGDEVIVEFKKTTSDDLEFLEPAVIGFKSNPAFCKGYQFFGTTERVHYDTVGGRTGVVGYLTFVTYKNDPENEGLLILTAIPKMTNFDDEVIEKTPADLFSMNEAGVINPWHQPDTGNPHQFFSDFAIFDEGKVKSNPWLLSQWCAALPCHALYWESGAHAGDQYSLYDAGYDYAPNLFKGAKGASQVPDTDWYQRGNYVVVTSDEFGSRMFIIMNDVNHVFYCYPADVYNDDEATPDGKKTNVDPLFVQSVNCPWPEWVNIESIKSANTNFNPIWQFSPSGLKACCVTGHRQEPWTDGGESAAVYRSNRSPKYLPVREDYPGVVELLFSITLTGPNPEDFTFNIDLGTAIYSKTQPTNQRQYPISVGYAIRDYPLDSDNPIVQRNELVLLEYRHYQDHPDYYQEIVISEDRTDQMTIRPCFLSLAVVSFLRGGAWTEYKKWLAWYSSVGNQDVWIQSRNNDRRFTPRGEDFPEVEKETSSFTDGLWDRFNYVGNVQFMDLRSLSWTVGASIMLEGQSFKVGRLGPNWSFEASLLSVNVFGEEKHRQSAGHPLMKAAIDDYFDLANSFTSLDGMTGIDINATFSRGNWNFPVSLLMPLTVNNGSFSSTNFSGSNRTCGQWRTEAIADRFSISTAIPPGANDKIFYSPLPFLYFESVDSSVYFNISRGHYAWVVQSVDSYVAAGSNTFNGYPFGVIHHNRVAGVTLTAMNALHQHTRISHNGSWACFIGPISTKTTIQQIRENPDWTLGNPERDVVDRPERETFIFDKVYIRTEDEFGKLERYAESTHLELFNSAFDKTLNVTDYYPEFAIYQDGFSGGTIHTDVFKIKIANNNNPGESIFRTGLRRKASFWLRERGSSIIKQDNTPVGSPEVYYLGLYGPIAPLWMSQYMFWGNSYGAGIGPFVADFAYMELFFPAYAPVTSVSGTQLPLVFPNPAMEALFN
jgi:hypothetical protein